MNDSELVVRAVGPAAHDGRLALTEVARIAGELQATLERIAIALTGGESFKGRRPQEIVNAVRLELTGFSPGSAILEISPPADAIIEHGLLGQSLDMLLAGVESISRAGNELPDSFNRHVVEGLARLAAGISPGGVRSIQITRRDGRSVTIDEDFRRVIRELRGTADRGEVTIVGRLHMGDFAPSALRCRIDTISTTVPCTFDEPLTDAVLAAMGAMVVATGMAELQSDGRVVRALELLSISRVNEARRVDINQLAAQQGVSPVRSVADFAAISDLTDEEYDRFVREALSAR